LLILSSALAVDPIHTRLGLVQLHRQVSPVEGMQATLQLLRQYCLPHHQVHLLQAGKNLAFLLRSAKVGELFGPGTGGARLGEEVPLNGVGTGVTSVMFRMHLFE
jgi:hypothetical protein